MSEHKTEKKAGMNLKEAYRLVYQDLIRRGGYRIGIYRYIGAFARAEGVRMLMEDIAFFAGKEEEYIALYNANEQESLMYLAKPEHRE